MSENRPPPEGNVSWACGPPESTTSPPPHNSPTFLTHVTRRKFYVRRRRMCGGLQTGPARPAPGRIRGYRVRRFAPRATPGRTAADVIVNLGVGAVSQ